MKDRALLACIVASGSGSRQELRGETELAQTIDSRLADMDLPNSWLLYWFGHEAPFPGTS